MVVRALDRSVLEGEDVMPADLQVWGVGLKEAFKERFREGDIVVVGNVRVRKFGAREFLEVRGDTGLELAGEVEGDGEGVEEAERLVRALGRPDPHAALVH